MIPVLLLAALSVPAPAAALAPTAGALDAAAQQRAETCIAAARNLRDDQHLVINGRHEVRWRADGCEVDIRIRGDLRFTDDFRGIADLSGGSVRIREEGRVERDLRIEPGRSGAPSYDYRVDRTRREMDAEGRAWLESVLLQLFRRTGYAAAERVPYLLRTAGAEGVLAELERTESTSLQRRMIIALLDTPGAGQDLVSRALGLARSWSSDHAKAELVKSLAERTGGDARARREAWSLARSLDSDHYATETARRLLRGNAPASEVQAALAVVGTLDSDHYRNELLRALADEPALRGPLLEVYLQEAARIDSDHYRAEALTTLLKRAPLGAADLVRLIRATSEIDSSHYRTQVLRGVASERKLEGAVREAYLEAAESIESGHYRAEALRVLVRTETR